MKQPRAHPPRLATVADADSVARLLDAFNSEYDDPTPGIDVLATRLERLLLAGNVLALLSGDPATGFALLTLRPNVWYEGPVALLDELYVVPELRGRGLGSALLAAAEDATRARGGQLLEINVDGDDVDARRSMRDTATPIASRARTSHSSTTTGNWKPACPDEREARPVLRSFTDTIGRSARPPEPTVRAGRTRCPPGR